MQVWISIQTCIPEGHLHRVTYTRCRIDTINSPDDGHILTHSPTPRCRVLFEKLTGLQLVKKFPVFHGTRRFITALTSVHHLSLSWASPVQSIYPHPTSWRSVLILSTHLRLGLPSGLFPSGFPTKTLYTPLSSTISLCMLRDFPPTNIPPHHGDPSRGVVYLRIVLSPEQASRM